MCFFLYQLDCVTNLFKRCRCPTKSLINQNMKKQNKMIVRVMTKNPIRFLSHRKNILAKKYIYLSHILWLLLSTNYVEKYFAWDWTCLFSWVYVYDLSLVYIYSCTNVSDFDDLCVFTAILFSARMIISYQINCWS